MGSRAHKLGVPLGHVSHIEQWESSGHSTGSLQGLHQNHVEGLGLRVYILTNADF